MVSNRYFTRGMQVAIDLCVLSVAYWVAFLLRFEGLPELLYLKLLFFTWPYVVGFQYLVLAALGVQRMSWRYVGIGDTRRILVGLAIATAVLVGVRFGLTPFGGYARYALIPLGVIGMDFTLAFLGVTGIRVLRRIVSEREERDRRHLERGASEKRTLLLGAGRAGVLVAREVTQNPHLGMKVVGFLDDDRVKRGIRIQGAPVLGEIADLPRVALEREVEQAIITITAAPGAAIRKIVHLCESISMPVRIIPGIHEILEGRVNLSRIREVTIEDLLGREAVELDLDAIRAFIHGKRVLVTGAGGSIGSELCRLVARFDPEKLVLLEQAENALFEIHSELRRDLPETNSIPVIADVCDEDRVDRIFTEHRPQVLFHAAAHKHVPMMEWNSCEAIKNNVFGTRTVAEAAHRHRTGAFVLISTDKAVNPTSVMGASKRVAEITIQAMSQRPDTETKFMAVRFGNVLGSAGSVIPVFRTQIRDGGPVTVTHPDMKRYFMTIPEACQLVMQTATMGEGGEIFVLDMGDPVRIVALARDMIKLSGLTEDEIPIVYSGVREGEKLFEELSMDSEQMARTRHKKIFIGRIDAHPPDVVEAWLEQLEAIRNDTSREAVREALRDVVAEMREPDDATSEDAPAPTGD